jgi:hypothetical protein
MESQRSIHNLLFIYWWMCQKVASNILRHLPPPIVKKSVSWQNYGWHEAEKEISTFVHVSCITIHSGSNFCLYQLHTEKGEGWINYLWLPWQFSHISHVSRHHWVSSRIHESERRRNQAFRVDPLMHMSWELKELWERWWRLKFLGD